MDPRAHRGCPRGGAWKRRRRAEGKGGVEVSYGAQLQRRVGEKGGEDGEREAALGGLGEAGLTLPALWRGCPVAPHPLPLGIAPCQPTAVRASFGSRFVPGAGTGHTPLAVGNGRRDVRALSAVWSSCPGSLGGNFLLGSLRVTGHSGCWEGRETSARWNVIVDVYPLAPQQICAFCRSLGCKC